MIYYGSIGTPIVAVESGYIEALGWNQYGGWRVGIRSIGNGTVSLADIIE